MNKSEHDPMYRFFGPRYWLLWAALGLLRLYSLLPFSFLLKSGRALGPVLRFLLPKRVAIARKNIRACFPERNSKQHEQMIQEHFCSLGISMFEAAIGYWASDARIEQLCTFEGMEHIEAAQAQGKGVLMLTAHFTTLELSGRAMAMSVKRVAGIYREHTNPLMNEIIRRGRLQSADKLVEKSDVRSIIRCLRDGMAIWYAPDQSYRRKLGGMVPFFDVPAETNIATPAIAKISGAPVVPFYPIRTDDGHYRLVVLPALDDFPTADPIADTLRTNRILEDRIRINPDQYYWIHRRFKNRGPDYPDFYAD